VSQAAGIPTGAIIERGTNANGEFTRFADGTQICARIQTADAGGNSFWTFPAAFSASPFVNITVFASGLAAITGRVNAISATGATWNLVTAAGVRTGDQAFLTAIGRWF
jgi:hypothetical protein